MTDTWDVTAGHPRRRQILAVLCLSLLIVVIDNTILNTALPTLSKDLGASTTQLQWITDAYSLVFAAILLTAGALGDRHGRKRSLLLGLGIFGLGSMAAALSTSADQLIVARAAMGIGGAFVMPATLSILTAVFPPKERAGAIGSWSAVSGLGIVLGPTLGGLLLSHFSWSSVFWVNVPLAAVSVLLVAVVIPGLPGQGAGRRLDLAGALLSVLWSVAIVDALIEGPDRGWSSTGTLVEVGAGIALLGLFVARELIAANPLIDLRIFAHRAFASGSVAMTLTFFVLMGGLFSLTQYMQLVHGFTPLSAGLRSMPFAAGVLVLAPASSRVVTKVGSRVLIPLGLTIVGVAFLLLTRATPTTPYHALAVSLTLMGAGMGLITPAAGDALMSVLPDDQASVGSALNDTLQELGSSLGVAVIGSVVSSSYRHGIDAAALPAAAAGPARDSIAAAGAVAARAGALGPQVTAVAHDSFTTAMTHGSWCAGLAALVAATATAFILPRRESATVAELAPVLVADAA